MERYDLTVMQPVWFSLRISAPLEAPPFHLFVSLLCIRFSISSLNSTCPSSDFTRECVLIRAKFRQNAGGNVGWRGPRFHTRAIRYIMHHRKTRWVGLEGNRKVRGNIDAQGIWDWRLITLSALNGLQMCHHTLRPIAPSPSWLIGYVIDWSSDNLFGSITDVLV